MTVQTLVSEAVLLTLLNNHVPRMLLVERDGKRIVICSTQLRPGDRIKGTVQ